MWRGSDLTIDLDRCTALLGVYLFGHHVVSVFVFGPGPGSWTDCDRGRRSVGPVYVLDSLVKSSLHIARHWLVDP